MVFGATLIALFAAGGFSAAREIGDREYAVDGRGDDGGALPDVPMTVAKTDASVLTDNGRLAFSKRVFTFSGSFADVFTALPDGAGQTNLTNVPAAAAVEPTWSPGGTEIAFSFIGDIWAMNNNGSNQRQLANSASAETNPSWSATGKIAYERDSQVWTMNADGTGQAVFSSITQPSPTAPSWSFDGSKLAFVSGGEIWVINSNGTNERRVTINATADKDPAWSPDGTKIVFSTGTRIAVINLNGTNQANLTDGPDDRKPSWSSDATRIAFVRRGTTANGIYIMDAVGANQVRAIADVQTSRGTENDDPVWEPIVHAPNTFSVSGRIVRVGASLGGVNVNLIGAAEALTATDALGNYKFSGLPGGGNYLVVPSLANHVFAPATRTFNGLSSNAIADFIATETCSGANCRTNGKIAFVRSADIYTMNPDGTNQTNITNNGANNSQPNYSPDGSKIVFSTNRDGNNEIYQMNGDGGSPVRLTNNPASDTSPSFSPDGSKIVFVSDRDGNSEIYKMNSNGTTPVRLTTDPAGDTVPSFSPDGAKIIFVTARSGAGRIFTMNADGTNQAVISDIAGFYNRPSYSPDGTKIIFVYGADVTAQTIYTMNADGTNRVQYPVGRSSPTYAPDGRKVVYVCCFGSGQLQDGVRSVNADGTSSLNLTTEALDDWPDWQPMVPPGNVNRRFLFDFDGDGRSDISVFRPAENKWYILRSSDSAVVQLVFGLAGDIPSPADFDGDGRTDPAIFRPSSGDWWYLSSVDGGQKSVHWGAAGDVPRPSDFDGDGKADWIVFRPSENKWYRFGSTGAVSIKSFGLAGDKPLTGDFDGDGRSDLAIYRPSTGTWWYQSSVTNVQLASRWGLSTDIPAPADFDGDGKTDLAVYRPAEGIWYVVNSSNGTFSILRFGLAADKPVPTDYDGDGKADFAVYRPSTGIWYLLQSANGFRASQFGISTDIPAPGAFVP